MNKSIRAFALLGLFLPFFAKAQEEPSLNKEIEFIKEGKISLPDVNRNYEKITFDIPKTEMEEQDYDYELVTGDVSKLDMKIRVRTLNPDELKKLYGNYVKAGFGNYVTPYFEGYFNSKRSDKYLYGVHLRHLSSKNGPVDFARTSENIAEAYGTYFLRSAAVDGKVYYKRNRYNFYGFNQSLLEDPDEDSLKIVYNQFGGQVTLRNIETEDELNYNVKLKYNRISSSFSNENEILTDFNGRYWIDDEKEFDLSGIYSYSVRDYIEPYSRHFFQIKPGIIIRKPSFRALAGLNVAYASDTLVSPKFHVYPRLEGEYYLIPKELTVYGGIGGEMQRNTLSSFVDENPWLDPGVALINTNKKFEAFAGVKGNTFERLNYKARLAYQTFEYLPLFVNNPSDTSRFSVLYDTGNSNVINFMGAVSYDFTEKFRAGITANFYNYDLSQAEEAWHRPNVDISLLSTYNLYKKIYFNLDIYYLGGITARDFESGEAVDLDNIFDLNAKIDYRFSDTFSAFIEGRNLIGKNYERYLNYPVRGVNVLAGVSLTF